MMKSQLNVNYVKIFPTLLNTFPFIRKKIYHIVYYFINIYHIDISYFVVVIKRAGKL